MSTPVAAKKPWDARNIHVVPHDASYYVCPLDVVKCNMQVDPAKYKGLIQGLKLVIKEEGTGVTGIFKGWLPTLIGYSAQGFFKFGLYEVFKDQYMNLAGEETATKYKGLIWLSASASAEFFADIALCPMEMVKVKMQTSKPEEKFPLKLGGAISALKANPNSNFPFGSVVPLWSRQIPYTMAKFYFFEKVVQLFYDNVFTAPRDTYSKGTQLGITFASGYIAGVICAIVSHPADTLVSLKGKAANQGKTYGQIANEFGTANLFTKGLSTRILMIGTLTGLQWWIYDTYKTIMGMGASGGGSKK